MYAFRMFIYTVTCYNHGIFELYFEYLTSAYFFPTSLVLPCLRVFFPEYISCVVLLVFCTYLSHSLTSYLSPYVAVGSEYFA